MRYCGRNGFIPTYFSKLEHRPAKPTTPKRPARRGGSSASAAPEHRTLGSFGETEAEYHRKLREYDVDIYKNFYGPFFPQFPKDPNTDWVKNISDSGLYSGGTLDQVRTDWQRTYEQVPAEFITVIFHYAQQPKDDVIRELELFMSKVVPSLEAAEPDAVAAE